MHRVFICDDEEKILRDISLSVKKLLKDADIEEFSESGELLDRLRENGCQILLLDIDMPKMGGLEIAAELSALSPKPLLVFVTSHDELVYDSLQYHPFGFVRKGHLDSELPKILADCEKELAAEERHFCFHTENSDFKLPLNDIIYFESEGNYLKLFAKSGEYRFRGTMGAVEGSLSGSGFVRVHKGFLVNQAEVKILRADKIELNSGASIPLGRSFADSAKKNSHEVYAEMKNRELEKEPDLQREKYNTLLSEKSRIEYELKELRAERESLLKQEGEIRALHESIRRIKHDMRNHLMVIGSYLSDGDYDNAKDYTSKILDKLNSARIYVDTGNSLMNHILNEKLNFARERGISVKAEIENLSFSKMESLDFSAMLSNILDNALEASLKEKAPEITVTISAKRGYETISVKNRITDSVLARNPDLCTEKADKHKHGIGVRQIKAAAEKYGGMYDFYEEEGYFCVCVFIPA